MTNMITGNIHGVSADISTIAGYTQYNLQIISRDNSLGEIMLNFNSRRAVAIIDYDAFDEVSEEDRVFLTIKYPKLSELFKNKKGKQ